MPLRSLGPIELRCRSDVLIKGDCPFVEKSIEVDRIGLWGIPWSHSLSGVIRSDN